MPSLSDTSPEARRVVLELLRKAPPHRKLALMDQLNASLRLLVVSELRQSNPDISEQELGVRLAERLYGADVADLVAQRAKSID